MVIVNYQGGSMIFSPEPKKSIEDLFGRNDELKELDKLVRKNRIILVTGMSRIGKTISCKRVSK